MIAVIVGAICLAGKVAGKAIIGNLLERRESRSKEKSRLQAAI